MSTQASAGKLAKEKTRMRRSTRCVALFVTIVTMPLAAAAADTWVRTFEGPGYGALFAVVFTQDAEILAAGATNHLHVPPYSGDALLMKLTLDGNLVWERTWGGAGYEQALAVAPAGDGGFYVFGETDSYGAGDRDFFLLKIDACGIETWSRTYGGPGREWPYGMLALANGDLLLYGFTTFENGARRQYAVRVDPAGDVVWEHAEGTADEEIALDALETAEGDLVLCVLFDEDGGLVQLDAGGGVLWSKRYELPGWQFASCVAPAEGGEFLLAGFSMTEGARRQVDTWLVRCAADGDFLWETVFGNPTSDDYAQAMLRLRDGTYLIGGLGNGMPLTCVDSDGNVLWSRLLAGPRVHAAEGLVDLDEGGFLVAGLIQIVNGRSYDAILVRTNAEGQVAPRED